MADFEGEEIMKAEVKPIQPINIEFENHIELQKFVNWASGREKTQATQNVRNKFAAYIEKKKRG